MKNREDLFRKVSLERLSSPEQLDQLINITTTKSWVALTALVAILMAVVLWSVAGKIQTHVMGSGVLIRTGGVFNVETEGSGMLSEYLVGTGDLVIKGQRVARVAQPDLEDQIDNAEAALADFKEEAQEQKTFDKENFELKMKALNKEHENIDYLIQTSQKKLNWLKEKISNQEKLLEEGLVTHQSLQSTKEAYFQAEGDLQKGQNQLKQIVINESNLKQEVRKTELEAENKIKNFSREIKILKKQLKENSEVISPYQGRVISILYDSGELVSRGAPVLTMELTGEGIKELEAVVYVDAIQGKKIKPGMLVQISPSTIKREEHGYMIGQVREISEFPVSPQEMMRLLRNEDLVKTFTVSGAPFEVYVDMLEDPATPSGYKWSSRKGPAQKILSGTLCTGQVTVEKQRPITLVIPILKKFFGVE